MAKNKYSPKSTTPQSKTKIRGEIKGRYSPSNCGGGKSSINNMKVDAESYSVGRGKNYSDWTKGSALVDGGAFRIYYSDQAEFLGGIYGKSNVEKWSNSKIHNTYKNLIGREYSAMLKEQNKKNKRSES